MKKSVKSIYDELKEDTQNDRLAKDLNNHNWLFHKIITNQSVPGQNKNTKKDFELKQNMKKAKKCSKETKSSGATKRSLSQPDHTDGSQAKLTKRPSDRSMPDLVDPITIISDVKVASNPNNLDCSSPLLKKILNREESYSKSYLSKNSGPNKNRTPVDQGQEGETSGAQSFELIAGEASLSKDLQVSKETPKLIKHNLPVPVLPARKKYRQHSAEVATSVKTRELTRVQKKCETENLLDSKSKMDYKEVMQCLNANNITTISQLIEVIESHKSQDQKTLLTEEQRKILDFLKSKDISTLEKLIEKLLDEDEVVFVNEEVIPDGQKIVSQKTVETLVAHSDDIKQALHVIKIITNNDWCKNLLLPSIQGASNPREHGEPQPSCSTQRAIPDKDSQEKGDVSSIVDLEEEDNKSDECLLTESQPVVTTPVEIQIEQPVIDVAGTETRDACVRTLQSDFCGEYDPGPTTSTQPEEATVVASRQPTPPQTSNSPFTAHAMPLMVQRTGSTNGRKRTYTSRDPRLNAERREQHLTTNSQYNQLGSPHNTQQVAQNTPLVLHNAAPQPHTSQASASNVLVPPHSSHQLPHNINTQRLQNSQVMPRNTRQLSPQAAHTPPHNPQLFPHHAHQIARANHPPLHYHHEVHANRRPNSNRYGYNCFNLSHGSMGQNMVYGTNNHMRHHNPYGAQSNSSYSYCQHWRPHHNIGHHGQHWHRPMLNHQTTNTTPSNQIITCTTLANYTMTHTGMNSRTVTNTSVASHTIATPTISLSAMSNSTVAETTNLAGYRHRRTTQAVATAIQWTPEFANMNGAHWQAHDNAASQNRSSVSNTQGPHRPSLMDTNTHAGNNERQFANAPADRVSPQIAEIMPEWLWHCRHWPDI